MRRQFGSPEVNLVLTVEQTYKQAVANGYLQQLQAYGVGKGLSIEEAEQRMKDGLGQELHEQEGDAYRRIQNIVELTRSQKGSVSTGDTNVKSSISPATDVAPPKNSTAQKETTE